LLLSNVWIILPLIQRDLMTVFTHRGLSPHQFTPMSGAHQSSHRMSGQHILPGIGRSFRAAHRCSHRWA
jgi:hypothetical protein